MSSGPELFIGASEENTDNMCIGFKNNTRRKRPYVTLNLSQIFPKKFFS